MALCFIPSHGNETEAPDSLTLVQDVASSIEEALDLAKQMKEVTDKEEEAIKNAATELHDETDSLMALMSGPMSGLLAQAARMLDMDGTKNCQDLANLGITESGTFQLDPDGLNKGQAPINVLCDQANEIDH